LNQKQQKIEAEKEQTQKALEAKTEALKAEQQTRYFQSVALAYREWQDGNSDRAKQLLADCPPELRRWEWHYLDRLCHSELLVLQGHRYQVNDVAFSADGRRLVTASADRTIGLWDSTTGQELLRVGTGHEVTGVTLSSDARYLAAVGMRSRISGPHSI